MQRCEFTQSWYEPSRKQSKLIGMGAGKSSRGAEGERGLVNAQRTPAETPSSTLAGLLLGANSHGGEVNSPTHGRAHLPGLCEALRSAGQPGRITLRGGRCLLSTVHHRGVSSGSYALMTEQFCAVLRFSSFIWERGRCFDDRSLNRGYANDKLGGRC